MENNRKNMRSHETLNQKRSEKPMKLNTVLKPHKNNNSRSRPSSKKPGQEATPKSSVQTTDPNNISKMNQSRSKSPVDLLMDAKASLSHSNLSGNQRHERPNLVSKFHTSKGGNTAS